MIVKLARYEVRKDALPEALEAVRAFVDEVGRKEGGTAYYEAYQEKEHPTRFVHRMAFRTPAAEKYHQGTPWGRAFLAKLAPLCIEAPAFVELTRIE